MTSQSLAIRQLKADAHRAGATGVLIIRDAHSPQLIFEVEGKPAMLDLDGKLLLVAVFAETDGGSSGIES